MRHASIVIALLGTTGGAHCADFGIRDFAYDITTLDIGRGEAVMAVGDLNGDGHLDVVVASQDDDVALLLAGDGHGGLRERARIATGPNPTHLQVVDIDRDGHADLAIANHETTVVTLLRGDGNGGFAHAFGSPFAVDVAPHAHVVELHDLDGDGDLDLVVDDRNRNGLRVYAAERDGLFAGTGRLVALGGDPYLGMAIGDIDGDGRPDLLTPNPNEIGVALNTAAGFAPAKAIDARNPFAVALADTDNDGHLDLLIGNETGRPAVELRHGDGNGGFGKRIAFRLASGGKRIVTGDIDGQPGRDFLAVSWNGAAIIGLGGAQPGAVAVPLGAIANPWGAVIADLNGDQRGDLLIADGQRALVNVYLSRAVKPATDAR